MIYKFSTTLPKQSISNHSLISMVSHTSNFIRHKSIPSEGELIIDDAVKGQSISGRQLINDLINASG